MKNEIRKRQKCRIRKQTLNKYENYENEMVVKNKIKKELLKRATESELER